MGIGIHSNIRGVGTDWCSTLFRLLTSVFVFLSVPLLQDTMGQIIKSLMSFCQSVSLSVSTLTAAALIRF